MAGKKEVLHTFKSCEEFSAWLNQAVADLDRQKSEVVRACILIGLPLICANPSVIDHIRLEDFEKKNCREA